MREVSFLFKFRAFALSGFVVALIFSLVVSALSFVQTRADAGQSATDDRSGGRVLKSEQSPTVYFVSAAGFKLAISSAKIFLSYGYKWQDVALVSEQELSQSQQAEYVKQIGSAAVYKIENGQKRYLTQAAASVLAIEPNSVLPVNKTEFKFYKLGTTVSEAEAKKIVESKKQTAFQPAENSPAQKCTADERVGGVDGCIIYRALEENNVQLCEQAHDENWKAKCFGSFLSTSGDPLVNCNKLTETAAKDTCIQVIALGKKDLTLCQKITAQDIRLQCAASIGIANKNITACDSLPDNQTQISKDACKFTFALVNNQQNVCEQISAVSAYKTACQKSFTQGQTQPLQ